MGVEQVGAPDISVEMVLNLQMIVEIEGEK